MNYKKWLLNGLIVCLVSPCFGAQEAQQIGWVNHDVPDDLEPGQFYNSKTLNVGAMVWNIALSPDERLLGVGGCESLAIIDMETCHTMRSFPRYFEIVALAWLHRGPYIAHESPSSHDIEMRNVITGWVVQRFKSFNDDLINSVAMSPDDKTIVSGLDDSTVNIWDSVSGECIQRLEGHKGWVNSVAIGRDDKTVISGSDDKTIKVWDIRLGKCVKTLKGHYKKVNTIAMSPDDKTIVSGSDDRTVNVWDIRSSKKSTQTLQGHDKKVYTIAINPDDKTIVSGSWDSTVNIWDSLSGECKQTLKVHNGVKSVIISSDGKRIVSGSGDGTVKVWEQKK